MTTLLWKILRIFFPDPNIETALIAMDNFAAMQAKAKQLVQIYKPVHDNPMASAAILVHTESNTPTKHKSSQPKSNQHQLAPINQSQDPQPTADNGYTGGQRGCRRGCSGSSRGRGDSRHSENRFDQNDLGASHGQQNRDFHYN